MMTLPSALFLFAITFVVVQGQETNFTGPSYLSCSYAEWGKIGGCSFDNDAFCTDSCLGNGINQLDELLPFLDASASIIYIRVACCSTAIDCPPSCTRLEGAPPEPAPVSATQNFTGGGFVTCPFVDFFALQDNQCTRDFIACHVCDNGDLSIIFEPGDEFIVIPLPCDCLRLKNCPETCTFSLEAPTVPSPGNVSVPVPSPPVSQPVQSPVPNANNTVSSEASSGRVWMTAVLPIILGWSMVL